MPRLMPVPLPWRSKTFEVVGQSSVQLDYKGSQTMGREGAIKVENVKNSVYTARKWMKKATGILGADIAHWPPHVRTAYTTYFKHAPVNGAHLQAVRNVMVTTRAGLGNPMVIAAICRWRGEKGSSTQGYVRGTAGRIHVNLKEFKSNSDTVEQVCIVVHEATHKFATTGDHGYFGTSDWVSMTVAQAVDNADSFCYFVRDVNQSVVAVAVDEDDDYGIGSLFG